MEYFVLHYNIRNKKFSLKQESQNFRQLTDFCCVSSHIFMFIGIISWGPCENTECWASHPEFLTQHIWCGAWEFPSLKSSQEMSMLAVPLYTLKTTALGSSQVKLLWEQINCIEGLMFSKKMPSQNDRGDCSWWTAQQNGQNSQYSPEDSAASRVAFRY